MTFVPIDDVAALPADHVDPAVIPSPGDVLAAQTLGSIDVKAYDEAWPDRAARTMW